MFGLIFTVTVLPSALICGGPLAMSGSGGPPPGLNAYSGRWVAWTTRLSIWKYAWPGSRCSQASLDTTFSVPPRAWPWSGLMVARPLGRAAPPLLPVLVELPPPDDEPHAAIASAATPAASAAGTGLGVRMC